MKTSVSLKASVVMVLTTLVCFLDTGCKKDEALINKEEESLTGPDSKTDYPGDVIQSWIRLQLKLTRTNPASPLIYGRIYAYTGITAYESVVPGLASYQSLADQINSFPDLPSINLSDGYYWPASANAGMAAIVKSLFPVTAPNTASIDSLEAANNVLYAGEASAEVLARSNAYGKQVAATIFEWSKTDGATENPPYTPPMGPGLWQPTPPAFMPASFPYWGNARLMVSQSGMGLEKYVPAVFSEDPVSAYYALAQRIYDVSQSLTDDQKIARAV
jgi:hypothetical protein